MARSKSAKSPKPKAKAKKANRSLKNVESRQIIQDFNDANNHFQAVAGDLFELAKDQSNLSPDFKRVLRKLKVASFGVDVTSEAVTEEVKKETGGYAGYVQRRKTKGSRRVGLKVSSASMPENVATIIEAAKGSNKDSRSFDLRERSPPKKKKKSNAPSIMSACSGSDQDNVKVYSVTVRATTAHIKVPDPVNRTVYQPLELAIVLSRIDQKYRRTLASLWKDADLVPVNDQQCARLCHSYMNGGDVA